MLCKATSIFPLAAIAIEKGGHVAIGLGDYHYGDLGAPTDVELVRRLVAVAAARGRMTATPAEARLLIGV